MGCLMSMIGTKPAINGSGMRVGFDCGGHLEALPVLMTEKRRHRLISL